MNKKFFIKIPLFALSFFCFLLTAEQKNTDSLLNESTTVITNQNNTQSEQKNQALPDSSVVIRKEINKSLSPSPEVEATKETQGQKEVDAFFKEEVEREISEVDVSSNERFLEFGLEYPMNFGIHLRYLLSNNFYARFGLGFMSRFFLDTFEKLSPSFGYLNEEETKLISDTFEDSLYLDFRLAWLPYLQESGGGPYLELGLSGIFYGSGELSGSTLSKSIEDTEFDELKNYSVKTNAYNATAHIGYQIPFEKVKLNIEVGVIKILDTNILGVKTLSAPKLLSVKQKKSFKNFLKEKGWIFPTVSAWISFAF